MRIDETHAAVAFDWWDRATWTPALKGASAAYLIAPRAGGDPGPVMIDFVREAIAAGVRRFVLQSGSPVPAGGPGYGQVHAWLAENATEWAVLRPSWFMQNFTEALNGQTIRAENAFYTAAGDGAWGSSTRPTSPARPSAPLPRPSR